MTAIDAVSDIKTHGHPQIQVNINHLGSFGSDEVYSFKSSSGRLEAVFTRESSVYKIGRLDAEDAAEGEDIALIATCYQHACGLGAHTIMSTISSREYLETMRTALGADYDNIQHEVDDAPLIDSVDSDGMVDLRQAAPAVE